METIESLRRRINSTEDLHSVVRTMKALAAVNIRQYERAVESLAEYNRAVEMGFQVLLKQKYEGITMAKPAPSERLGGIVFGSDQGMVGQFNEVIARYTAAEIEKGQVKQTNLILLAAGARVSARLEEAGYPAEDHISLPGSVLAITPVVQDVVLKI
jgi:F-type H+-transporting ATPase subunit gamma